MNTVRLRSVALQSVNHKVIIRSVANQQRRGWRRTLRGYGRQRRVHRDALVQSLGRMHGQPRGASHTTRPEESSFCEGEEGAMAKRARKRLQAIGAPMRPRPMKEMEVALDAMVDEGGKGVPGVVIGGRRGRVGGTADGRREASDRVFGFVVWINGMKWECCEVN